MNNSNNTDTNVVEEERRGAARLIHSGEVTLSHPLVGETTMKVHDSSAQVVFLVGPCQSLPGVGSTVKLQMQGMKESAPIVNAKIVRFKAWGVALTFCD